MVACSQTQAMIWLAMTQQATNTEIHKAAGMINNQYSKHRDDMETSTKNKAVIKKKKIKINSLTPVNIL